MKNSSKTENTKNNLPTNTSSSNKIEEKPSKNDKKTKETKDLPTSSQKIENKLKDPQETDSKIQVFIRKRPLLPIEMGKMDIISVPTDNSLVINDGTNTITSHFDYVFSEKTNQMQIYERIKGDLSSVFKGFNLSYFAYGQTGSGKTYTMFGADWDSLINKNVSNVKGSTQQNTFFQDFEKDLHYAGVIPRIVNEVFNLLKTQGNEDNFNIFCTFMQIYNEKIYDLLQDKNEAKPLNIRENNVEGIFVEGLTEYSVNTAQEALILMSRGEKNRIIRPTLKNAKSSRSHTIFQILIESSKADKNGNLQKAKINLCDLAGSEKINKDEQIELGHLSELKKINLSLTTLGKIIHILSNQTKLPLPFRESKLTRLLQDSLGGNTQTMIIANVSPVIDCIDETINTLKFAERAKNIIIKVKPNEISATDDAIINKLQQEINYLKDLLKMKRKTGLAGGGVGDVHTKLLYLQQENDRLRQNFVSIAEVEKLISENKLMKQELQKMQTISYDNEFMNSTNEINSLNDLLHNNKDTLEDFSDNFNKAKSKLNTNETRESFPLSVNVKKNSYNSENVSRNLKNTNSSNSNRSNFFFVGKMLLDEQGNINKTEVVIRTRGKNNSIETKKGFVEITNEEHKKEQEKIKQKIRAIERLKDLERIQKFNEEKLKQELEKIDKNKNNYKASTPNLHFFTKKNSNEFLKQKKKVDEYNKKLKLYEKNFLKI